MEHWSCRFVGMPYRKDEFDCAHLVELVLREQFGRTIELPKEHGAGVRERARVLEEHRYAFAVPATEPREGDGVILTCRGYDQHLGIWCAIGGEGWVLHNSQSFGSVCLHRLRTIGMQQMRLEGVYRWI